jgi:hypothetical protein
LLELADYALLGIDTCRLVEEEALREVLFEKRLEHILPLSQAQNKEHNKKERERKASALPKEKRHPAQSEQEDRE